MTFERFQNAVAKYRPDVTVSKHGEFAGSRNKVGIIFNGKSKVYLFDGSYEEILQKLNIEFTTEEAIREMQMLIRDAKARHGKLNRFSKKPIDTTAEVARLEAKLAEMMTRPRI